MSKWNRKQQRELPEVVDKMTRPKHGPRLESAFVVLSDLHFGKDLKVSQTTPILNVPLATYGISDEKVSRFFQARCLGHSTECVRMLPRYLRCLLWQLREYGFPRKKFDLLILLGDQSTLAHPESYRFLREYISETDYVVGNVNNECKGLGFVGVVPSDILAIPGNHDKLLQSNLHLYNNEFTSALGLREQVEPQRCAIAVRKFGTREFVFILIDPSTYCGEDLTLDKQWRKHLAAGKVSKELIEDVQTKLSLLREHGRLGTDVRLETTFSSAVKILLVHYPVDETRFRSTLEELVLPHGCEGIGELVSMLKSEFQLSIVLHGHLHVPLLYNYNGVQVISVSTSTRVDENGQTGFYLIKVFDSGSIVAEHHLWTGVTYTPDPSNTLTKDLGYFPPACKDRPAA